MSLQVPDTVQRLGRAGGELPPVLQARLLPPGLPGLQQDADLLQQCFKHVITELKQLAANVLCCVRFSAVCTPAASAFSLAGVGRAVLGRAPREIGVAFTWTQRRILNESCKLEEALGEANGEVHCPLPENTEFLSVQVTHGRDCRRGPAGGRRRGGAAAGAPEALQPQRPVVVPGLGGRGLARRRLHIVRLGRQAAQLPADPP
mmetsp:Transcript_54982/g.170297  ORF Transcript_54982/g.170297 Transcript_54982/m.170297 type:complete len:204 (-) Transcript_54982:483-1094(-)